MKIFSTLKDCYNSAYSSASTHGFKNGLFLGSKGTLSTAVMAGIFVAMIVFVIGATLIDPVAESTASVNETNLSSGAIALKNLLPLIFISLLVGAGVGAVVKAFKG